jgi:hypothetical protein
LISQARQAQLLPRQLPLPLLLPQVESKTGKNIYFHAQLNPVGMNFGYFLKKNSTAKRILELSRKTRPIGAAGRNAT